MSESAATGRDLIRAAFSDHEGAFHLFLDTLLESLQTVAVEDLLAAARQEFNTESDPLKKTWLCLLCGYLYLREREFGPALEIYEELIKDETLPALLRSHACFFKVQVLFAEAKLEEAIKVCEEAIALYEEGEDSIAVYHMNILGSCWRQMNDYRKALKYYNMALEQEKKFRPDDVFGGLYNNIANVHIDLGNIQDAIDAFAEALDVESRKQNAGNVIYLLSSIAGLLILEERYEEALEYAEKGLYQLSQTGSSRTRTINLVNVTEVHLDMGNLEEALKYAEEGLAVAEDTKETGLLLEMKLLYGAVLAAAKDDRAEAKIREALERALIAQGKLLAEKNDPAAYGCLLNAERNLRKRVQTPLIQTMKAQVQTLLKNIT
ncbi:MAG: tetratricopeptide repeat protein [Planctomycetota bacterium]|jgi:tetratricopeptide (TPR) repeat protein